MKGRDKVLVYDKDTNGYMFLKQNKLFEDISGYKHYNIEKIDVSKIDYIEV